MFQSHSLQKEKHIKCAFDNISCLVNFIFTNLDNPDNIDILEVYGMASGFNVGSISMKETGEGLLADGYIEK